MLVVFVFYLLWSKLVLGKLRFDRGRNGLDEKGGKWFWKLYLVRGCKCCDNGYGNGYWV